jgi:hypothetical protein
LKPINVTDANVKGQVREGIAQVFGEYLVLFGLHGDEDIEREMDRRHGATCG